MSLLQQKFVPKDIQIQKSIIDIKSYSDDDVGVFGFIDTKLVINNESWGPIRFHIVPNHLSSILGSNFIEDNEIAIILKRRKLIKHGPVDRFVNLTLESNNIRANEIKGEEHYFDAISETTFTFKGRSETIIDLRVHGLENPKTLFFENSNFLNSRLELVPSLQIVDKDSNIFRLLVINPLECSIKIPAGTVFVKLYEVAEIGQIRAEATQKTEEILSKIRIGSIPGELHERFRKLLTEFSFLFLDEEDILPVSKVAKFSIDTGNNLPVSLNPYRTPYSVRSELKKILEDFERNDLIEKSSSPWNSPAILVRKKTGGFRLVIDYRKLNSITSQINHPLPVIEDVLNNLHGSCIFSVLDLKKGFHQLEVEDSSKEKTAFSTEFGQFVWKRMPMGTRNSPSVFARVMDEVLKDVPKSEICCYLDDCLIHSSDNEAHFKNLRKFFIICANNNLRLNAKKAVFFEKKVDFLGFEVEDGNIRPSEDRIEAIRNRACPRNRDEALSLYGALSSHRRFIENFADLALPISQTYRGNFQWTQRAQEAFEEIKRIICSRALELYLPPSQGATFVLESDASERCLGGVLYFCEENRLGHDHDVGCLRPVAYFSQNLTEAQIKYVTMEKELLAGKLCFERWAVYLSYREFDWITDNSCVRYAQSLKTKNIKIQRWLAEMQGYSYNLIQRKSKRMKISDYLSRSQSQEVKINQINVDKNRLIEMQKADETLGIVYNFVKIDRWPNKFDPKIAGFKRWRELLKIQESGELVLHDPLDFDRICVPESLKLEIIEEYHCSQHTGIEITFKRISKKYFWLDMKSSISNFIRSCHYCQTSKPCNNPNKPPLGKFKTPSAPYEALAFDLVGPLRETDDGNIFILTCIDLFSKRVYAEPLACKEGQYLLGVFKKILFANPHFPRSVLMDNAREFNKLASYLTEKGIEPHYSPPRHPQSNGLIENFNRSLKSRLRARCKLENWDKFLYEVIHDCNSSDHSVVQMSPFAVEFGIIDAHNINDSSFRSYGARKYIEHKTIREKIEAEKDNRVKKFENPKFREYEIGDKIAIANFRSKFPPFLGPMTVSAKSKNGTKYTCVEDKSGKEFSRHANDIRSYILPDYETETQAEEVSRSPEPQTVRPDSNFENNEDNFSTFISPYFSTNYDRSPVVTASPANLDKFCPPENNELSESEPEQSLESEKSKIAKKDRKNEILKDFEGKNELGPGIDEVNLETVTRFDNADNPEISEYSENSEISENKELSESSGVSENTENSESSTENTWNSGSSEVSKNVENSEIRGVSESLEVSEKSVDSESSEISEGSKNTVNKSSSSDSSGDYVSKLPKPTGIRKTFYIDSSDQSTTENHAPRDLELSNIFRENEANEIDTPENSQSENVSSSNSSDLPHNPALDMITETETSMENCIPKLKSYDKLNLPEISNIKKRPRETSNNSPSPKKLQITDSDQFEVGKKRVICGQPFQNYQEESDSEEDDCIQMSINVKLENEHEDLFRILENEYEAIKQNSCINKGIMLKLSELTRPILIFVASKFGIEINEGVLKEKKSAELRLEIKDHIRKNFPSWKKSSSNEFLFLSIFHVEKTTSITKLDRPELKCLAASINLSNEVYLSKQKLVAKIEEYFTKERPLHPRNDKNELIFHPETNL